MISADVDTSGDFGFARGVDSIEAGGG